MMLTGLFDILVFLTIFGAVLYLTYVVTKIYGNKAGASLKSSYMEVIDTLRIGPDKQIILVSVGDKHILLSSCGKSLQHLCEVELELKTAAQQVKKTEIPVFKDVFDNIIGGLYAKGKKGATKNTKNFTDLSGNAFETNLAKLHSINTKLGNEDEVNEKI